MGSHSMRKHDSSSYAGVRCFTIQLFYPSSLHPTYRLPALTSTHFDWLLFSPLRVDSRWDHKTSIYVSAMQQQSIFFASWVLDIIRSRGSCNFLTDMSTQMVNTIVVIMQHAGLHGW